MTFGGNGDHERNICRFLPEGTLQGVQSSINYTRDPTCDSFFAVLLDLYHVALSNFQYGFDTAVSINIKLLGKITAEQSSFRSSTAFMPPKGSFTYLEWNQSRVPLPSRCVRRGLREIDRATQGFIDRVSTINYESLASWTDFGVTDHWTVFHSVGRRTGFLVASIVAFVGVTIQVVVTVQWPLYIGRSAYGYVLFTNEILNAFMQK